MKKALKRKLTLSKETIANLEADKLTQAVGGDNLLGIAFSDNWEKTTCV